MNLISKTVRSKSFGTGIVLDQTDISILVKFEKKTAKFIYPDAFEKFIEAENMDL